MTVVDIESRLAEVRQRIDAAAAPGQDVRVVAVTKRFDFDVVAAAVAAGCTDLGENYAQELAAKAGQAADRDLNVRWHMIGPVQRNKVKKIVNVVELWHAIDRTAILSEIAKRRPGAAVLLQVNFTGEDTKSGAEPDEVSRLVIEGQELGLNVRGLMAMGPTDTSIDPRPVFHRCRAAVDDLNLDVCSMGMSGDYESAVEEGSTMVRIGSAIFGSREMHL